MYLSFIGAEKIYFNGKKLFCDGLEPIIIIINSINQLFGWVGRSMLCHREPKLPPLHLLLNQKSQWDWNSQTDKTHSLQPRAFLNVQHLESNGLQQQNLALPCSFVMPCKSLHLKASVVGRGSIHQSFTRDSWLFCTGLSEAFHIYVLKGQKGAIPPTKKFLLVCLASSDGHHNHVVLTELSKWCLLKNFIITLLFSAILRMTIFCKS